MSTANQFGHESPEPSHPVCYEFGPFVLNMLQHALLKDGEPVALTPKTYDTLLVLVQNSGRMLSKDELMKALWPDSFVEESNLTQQVSTARRALGDSPSDPQYIVTVSGRGYRFIAKVRVSVGDKSTSDASLVFPNADNASLRDALSVEAQATQNPAFSVPASPVPIQRKRRSVILWLAIMGFLALAILLIARSLYRQPSQTALSTATSRSRSLAILPLQNLKQNPSDDFLGFSLADAIITKLDYVSSVTVRPSAAIQPYRNQVINIQKVAADLNVDTLLTGNFIHDRDKLRITYQLVDTKTEKILGRGTIDLKYDDLLMVQDRLSQQIIKELELNLSPSEAARIKHAPVNPLAYEYYLRGVDLHGQHKFPLAIKMLEKSTEIDPNYASTWAYLAASYTSDAAFEFGGREQYRRAQAAYERALALQPAQLEAQVFLANLLVDTGKVEQAVPLLREALKINPNNADVHWELGYAYRFGGMLNESVAECERARQIDPFVKSNGSVLNAYLYLGEYDKFLDSLPGVNDSAFFLFYRGLGFYHQKNWDLAAKDFDRAFDLHPDLYTQIGKALSDSIAHRNADGLEILRAAENRIKERGVGDPEGMYKIAQAYAVLGDKASALRMLRQSIGAGFFCYPYFVRDPLLEDVRNEPEFKELMNQALKRHEQFKAMFF